MIRKSTTSADRRSLDSQRPSRGAFLAAMVFLAAVSITLRGEPTPDVSWLITMCERMLNGEWAYVDIIETTPPFPMLLYMPGALCAKYIGGAPEIWTFAFAYASVLGPLWLAARILPTYVTEGGRSDWLILAPAAVVFFLLPRDAFAQREYFAAAWALPVTALFIRHAEDQTWPPLTDRILAAVLGGLSIAVKPPLFALPGIAVGLYYWGRTRSLSFLFPSSLVAAAAIGLAVTAASLVAFPDYLRTMWGIMRDVYVPVRLPAFAFLLYPGALGALAALAIALLLSFRSSAPAATISAIVAAGFLAVDFVQGKYFCSYHAFPAAPFATAAACVVVFRYWRSLVRAPSLIRAATVTVFGFASCAIAVLFFLGFADQRPVMRDLTWARTLARPRALAVSPIEDTSFPLARRIGAAWVGHAHSQWVARYVQYALDSRTLTPGEKERLLNYRRSDLQAILREIRDKRPDLIIEDTRPENSWLVPELNAMQPGFLEGYAAIAEEDGIRVLSRTEAVGSDFSVVQPNEVRYGR
jgi:hypothetical protein